jgi:putative endonuclease
MSQATTDFGKHGEDLAASYLTELGFEILHRNFRYGKNEVDIIAKRGGIISFVEVKSRHSLKFGHPLEAVTKAKQREMQKVAMHFISQHAAENWDYRFDAIAVLEQNGGVEITFIEDAFRIL